MIQIVKATDRYFAITWEQFNGQPVDITGTTMFMTVKLNKTDADPGTIQKNWNPVTFTDANGRTFDTTLGQTAILFSHTDTNIAIGTYYWDMKVISGSIVTAFEFGTLQITQNITISS